MISSAKTDTEKKYADVLHKQASDLAKMINLIQELSMAVSNNDKEKIESIINQIEAFGPQLSQYQKDMETIKNSDNTFKARLKEEDRKAHN